ncbi:MAG: PTS fructose transporter subunit EIIBC, partial [Ottowia sp.]
MSTQPATLLAVLNTPERLPHTLLAREVLHQAAAALGLLLRVQTHTPAGVQEPLTDEELAAAASPVLCIGPVPADLQERLQSLTVHSTSLQAVLDDPHAALAACLPEGVPSATSSVAANAASTGLAADAGAAPLRIVAITSCPTGIAHTFMAEEGL